MTSKPAVSPFDGLSIVIPAFNESRRIGATLRTIEEYAVSRLGDWEIIVVDDGSSDDTVEVALAGVKNSGNLKILKNGVNRGKGYSTRAGALGARKAYVLLTDADLSTPIDELDVLGAVATPDNVVIASRGLSESKLEVRQPWYRESMGRVFNLIVRGLVLPGISDSQCGFKLFGANVVRPIFENLKTDRFAFDVEVLATALHLGFVVHEVPVRWRNDEGTRVDALKDSLQMLKDVVSIWWRLKARKGHE